MGSSQGQFDYEVAIVGGGSAGYAAAQIAAGAGLRTVVLEGGEEVGGLCILRGCMPSKALLYAAEVRHLTRLAGQWGINIREAGFDFVKVMARKNGLIKEFADYRHQQLKSGDFEFIRAMVRFTGPHTLALDTGRVLTAKHFILSTGSIVAPSPLPDLEGAGYLDSDGALGLAKLPKSLIVLGGGAVAVEFAQFFARFDVKVTLVQRSAQMLLDFDTDAASELEKVFRREGIDVFTNTKLVGAGREGSLKWASFLFQDQIMRVTAEEILLALGRTPNTATLDLAKAGVGHRTGGILANARMQTSAPHIYAAGDCTGLHGIAHVAVQQGEVAAKNIAHPQQPCEMDYRLLTEVVFTEPQIAVVGLTEKKAREENISYLTASYPFSDHGKSIIMETRDGFVKLLANPASGEILGGACMGPMGGELIHEIIAAMSKRMTVRELAAMPHYHPTLAEIWTYPAEELAAKNRELMTRG